MKQTSLLAAVLVLIFLKQGNSQCLVNGDFAQFCGTQAPGCTRFDAPCLVNWARSHGTPNINVGATPAENTIFIFGYNMNGIRGEGLFASYNFIPAVNYKLKVRINVSTATSGSLYLYAANGIVESAYSGACGDAVPTVNSKQLISQITEANVGWKEYTIDFTPAASYSQLWLYAYSTSTEQYNCYIDYVFTCQDTCNSSVYYNNGTLPTGDVKVGNVYAGTTSAQGGSGTVNVSPTAVTNLIAAKEINLVPEFAATVTTGIFSANIQPCSDTGIITRVANTVNRNIDVSKFPKTDSIYMARLVDKSQGKRAKIHVYPNPVVNRLSADIYLDDGENISIRLLSSMGTIVRQIIPGKKSSGKQHIEIDVSNLPRGIYTLQVTDKSGVTTQKIEKIN